MTPQSDPGRDKAELLARMKRNAQAACERAANHDNDSILRKMEDAPGMNAAGRLFTEADLPTPGFEQEDVPVAVTAAPAS